MAVRRKAATSRAPADRSVKLSRLDDLLKARGALLDAIGEGPETAAALATLCGRLVDVWKEIGHISGEPAESFKDAPMLNLQKGLIEIGRAHPAARAEIIALLRRLGETVDV